VQVRFESAGEKVNKETVWKAHELVKEGKVFHVKSESNFYFFKVQNGKGEWIDVTYTLNPKTNKMEWGCGSTVQRGNKSWGCDMKDVDKSKPQCSHTLACAIHLNNLKKGGKNEMCRL